MMRHSALGAVAVFVFGALPPPARSGLCLGLRQPTIAPAELLAFIEIPAGGRVKYEVDAPSGRLVASRTLPDSLAYPANYGMLPCTRGGDGDPLDVLVLSEVPLEPGSLILVRPVGVLPMRDNDEQDDKILAVPLPAVDARGRAVTDVEQLPAMPLAQIRRFFTVYKGPTAGVLLAPWEGATSALATVRSAMARALATRPDTAVVRTAFITAATPADNIDSPAVYHGPDGLHWVIATAKATHQLVVYDAVTGQEVRRVGTGGAGAGQLQRPNGILVLDDSLLLVVERDNRRVQGFRLPSFEPLGTFGEAVLRRPYGLSAHREAGGYRLYVTDNYETVAEAVPPLAELGERVKSFRVAMDRGRLRAIFVRSFGDTTAAGAIRVTESILADPANNRLLIAEEFEGDSHLKVYTLDGRFTGETVGRGLFPQEAEGIALYACGDSAGYWIATDQGDTANTFHLFDRQSLRYVAPFSAERTSTTDGIALTQRAFGQFPAGALYVSNGDEAVSALSWTDIAAATGVAPGCPKAGPEPLGMWLPETAVDSETPDVLAECGIRFAVLAPHQVERRPPNGLPGEVRLSRGRILKRRKYSTSCSGSKMRPRSTGARLISPPTHNLTYTPHVRYLSHRCL